MQAPYLKTCSCVKVSHKHFSQSFNYIYCWHVVVQYVERADEENSGLRDLVKAQEQRMMHTSTEQNRENVNKGCAILEQEARLSALMIEAEVQLFVFSNQ